MPSSFITRLVVERLDDGGWKVEKRFVYHIGAQDSGIRVRVPAGFVTDFASIPRIFWSFGLSPYDEYGKAAVLHDWLYQTAKVSRAMADAVLLEAMWVLGVPRWKRWIVYSFVRVFGWLFFPSTRREMVEKVVEKHAEQREALGPAVTGGIVKQEGEPTSSEPRE